MVAGAVKSAARGVQQPDGWFAKHELWSTGTSITQLFIPSTVVTAWVATPPPSSNPRFSYDDQKNHLFG